jgi:zinc protease
MTLEVNVDPRRLPAPPGILHTRKVGDITVFGVPEIEKRVVAVRLYWDGGLASENLFTAGLHAVAMQAVIRSSTPVSGTSMAYQLESLGVQATGGVSDSSCYLDLRGPREVIHTALRRASSSIGSLKIDQAALRSAMSTVVYEIDRRSHNIKTVADDSLRAARLVRAGTTPAWACHGTAESIRDLRLSDVEAAVHALATECPLRVVVAGDLDLDTYLADVAPMAGTIASAGKPPVSSLGLVADPPPETRVRFSLQGQGCLLWGVLAPVASATDYVIVEIATHILAGWTGSRWNSLFRDELGYTYGTFANVEPFPLQDGKLGCLARAGMAVAQAALHDSRRLLLEDAETFLRERLSDAEVMRAATRLLRNELWYADSSRALVARAASFLQGGIPVEFAAKRMAALRAVDPDVFRSEIRRLFRAPTLVVVIPGGTQTAEPTWLGSAAPSRRSSDASDGVS